MAPKRALEDVNSGLHPDRAVALGISHTAGPSAKRRKHHHGVGTQDPLQENISSSKKRVRNIERLFQRKEHLPAHVKNELERELLAHKATIANKTFQKKRSKMISKYHMVRFFERKKAMRLAAQLRRSIDKSGDHQTKERLTQQLHVAEVDEAYAMHYPYAEPYVSLYGNPKLDREGNGSARKAMAAKAALTEERPELWSAIEEAMEEGPDALKRIRERRTEEESGSRRSRPKPTRKTALPQESGHGKPQLQNNSNEPGAHGQAALNRRERRLLLHQSSSGPTNVDSEDHDDAGGFFEEV